MCWRARSGGHSFTVPNPAVPSEGLALLGDPPIPPHCSHSPGGEGEPKSERGSKGAQGSYRLHPVDVAPWGWPLSCLSLGRWHCLLHATHLHAPRATLCQQERPGDTRSCLERGAHPQGDPPRVPRCPPCSHCCHPAPQGRLRGLWFPGPHLSPSSPPGTTRGLCGSRAGRR